MDFMVVVFFPIALFIGFFLALKQKKSPEVVYGTADKVGAALNILLAIVFAIGSCMPVFLAMVVRSAPDATAWQNVLCILASALIGAAPVYCAIALGHAAALRKKGHSIKSLVVQFSGIAGIVIPVLMFQLLESLPISWIVTGLN